MGLGFRVYVLGFWVEESETRLEVPGAFAQGNLEPNSNLQARLPDISEL